MATIKEVAQRAGVSVTTVSRVLNKRGYISQEMHDKIYATMEELNYQPNEVARSLTRRRTKIIGLLVPSVDNPYFSEVVNQLILSAMRHGYKVMIYASDGRNDRALEYVGMLKANQVDGIITGLRSRELDALLDDCPGLGGCIFLPGDQPLLRRESLEAMVRGFRAQKETERVILRLGWRAGGAEPLLGSPVLFGSGHFDALRALPEGKGGGAVIRQNPGCVRAVYARSAEELEDADTVERLEALKRFL